MSIGGFVEAVAGEDLLGGWGEEPVEEGLGGFGGFGGGDDSGFLDDFGRNYLGVAVDGKREGGENGVRVAAVEELEGLTNVFGVHYLGLKLVP